MYSETALRSLHGKLHSAFPVTFFKKRLVQKPAGICSVMIVLPEFSHRQCLKSNWVVTLNNTIWCVHSLLLDLDAQRSFSSILQELIDFWVGYRFSEVRRS